jgi:gluconolactonase
MPPSPLTSPARFEVRDLIKVVDTDAHEGPVYAPDEDALYFTSVPRPEVDIKRLELGSGAVTALVENAHAANGMTLGADGRLIVCEQSPAAITKIDRRSGEREVAIDNYDGLPLNSPNDVVERSDGTLWFTDPSYGYLQGFRPKPQLNDNVYRHDPVSGETTVFAGDFDKPNGLAFSPDERTLYVNDSGVNQEPGSFHPERPHHIRALDLESGAAHLFADIAPGQPDGMKVDSGGRVYCSSADGVHVFDPSGDRIGEIDLPGAVNFTFGGPGRNVLFITTDAAIWAAVLNAKGA